jgi:hypothetical protein
MDAKNIDDVLVQSMSNQETTHTNNAIVNEQVERPVEPPIENKGSSEASEPLETAAKQPDETPITDQESKVSSAPDSPIDEYGNPVEKSKTYTEEEVQRLIHDRLSRGRRNDNAPPQQVKKIQQDFEADENSEEPLAEQLKRFVYETITEREQRVSEQRWQQQQYAKQADFETKFTSGMGKYSDFHQVVDGKPITDHMVLATRAFDNPAAFVYGASKLHPQELDRIARIEDPYAQASEVGRLHERMLKERKQASNTSRPLEIPKGDMPQKTAPNSISIDERINNYGRQKRK